MKFVPLEKCLGLIKRCYELGLISGNIEIVLLALQDRAEEIE